MYLMHEHVVVVRFYVSKFTLFQAFVNSTYVVRWHFQIPYYIHHPGSLGSLEDVWSAWHMKTFPIVLRRA
jgi:hypothetical protein